MKRFASCLVLLLLLTGFQPVAPFPTRQIARPAVYLSLLDRDSGRVLQRHPHQGQTWVAGERGHRYAVRLRNATPERVLVVLSVDGINAVTGEVASPSQTGYVLRPWQTTDITGWRKSRDEVAQFVFSPPGESYAGRTGRGENLGVVGIAVFREKEATRLVHRPLGAPAAARSGDVAETRSARLGTGHGSREHSAVRDTTFIRATRSPAEVSELRYDSIQGLRARGIALDNGEEPTREPQAFPGRFVPDPPAD